MPPQMTQKKLCGLLFTLLSCEQAMQNREIIEEAKEREEERVEVIERSNDLLHSGTVSSFQMGFIINLNRRSRHIT